MAAINNRILIVVSMHSPRLCRRKNDRKFAARGVESKRKALGKVERSISETLWRSSGRMEVKSVLVSIQQVSVSTSLCLQLIGNEAVVLAADHHRPDRSAMLKIFRYFYSIMQR